jgi:WD40 repeat protein
MGNTMQRKKGVFGQLKDMQTMFCMAFSSQSEIYYTGTLNGSIYVWKGTKLEEIIPEAHEGAIYVMTTCSDGFVTAGRDGKIRLWDSNFTALTIIDVKDSLRYTEGLLNVWLKILNVLLFVFN